MTANTPALFLAALFLLGLIPAVIANSKGHPFIAWWLYGAFLFPFAFPHAILSRNTPHVAPRLGGAADMGGDNISSHTISAVRRDPPGPRLRNRDADRDQHGPDPTNTIRPTVDVSVGSDPTSRATAEDEDEPVAPLGRPPALSDRATAIGESDSGNPETATPTRAAPMIGPALSPPRLDFDRSTRDAPVVAAPWTDEDFARIAEGHFRRDRSWRGVGREIRGRSTDRVPHRSAGGISASWVVGAALAFAVLLAGYVVASDTLDTAFARHGAVEDGMARAISNIRIAFATFMSYVADEGPDRSATTTVAPADKTISRPAAAPGSGPILQYADVAPQSGPDSESIENAGESQIASPAAFSPRASTNARHAATRNTVRRVQASLRAHGYDVGPMDGKLGPQTQAAILAYQHETGLAPTGAIDRQLLANLESSRSFHNR